MQCITASIVLALSDDKYSGLKNGTSAPYFIASLAISSPSVVTTTLSIYLDLRPASIEYAIRGFPFKSIIFLSFIPLLPALAGIIANIFFNLKIQITTLYNYI